MVVGMGTWFVRVEARDHDHYWITCWVDNTGVQFMTQVDQGLVIDPNPQDVLSWLDQVGSLIQLWWGQLSELVHWSRSMWYWWLGREMRGRGEHRRAKQNGMSSEGQRIWNIKIDWAASSLITSKITLLMILWTFLEQLILIQHLTHHDSHSLEAVSHSSLSQVVTSHNTLVTLLTKLPASSGSRCHFPSHSEIPGT